MSQEFNEEYLRSTSFQSMMERLHPRKWNFLESMQQIAESSKGTLQNALQFGIGTRLEFLFTNNMYTHIITHTHIYIIFIYI